jgi:hypothetical protein
MNHEGQKIASSSVLLEHKVDMLLVSVVCAGNGIITSIF